MNHIFTILANTTDTAVQVTAAAQSQVVPNLTVFPYNFFIALVAGVVLAIAFELILTNLSLAAGLNVLGTVTSPDRRRGAPSAEEGPGVIGVIRKITSAVGIWTLVTASIALFFASWLAVELSLTASMLVGAIIGLVIWGLFYVTMVSFETSAIASLVGSLGWLAASGLKSAYKATTAVFTKSPEQRIADATVQAAREVKEELFGDIDADDVRDQIQKYIVQLKPDYGPREWHNEIAKLLDEVEIDAVVKKGARPDQQKIVAKLEAKGISSEQASKMASGVTHAFEKIKEERGKEKPAAEKVSDAAMKAAGLSDEQAHAFRGKIETYLRNTGKDQLSPEGIKADIEKLFKDPKSGFEALKGRAFSIDKDTLASILAQRKDIDKDKATQIIDKVQSTISSWIGTAQEKVGGVRAQAGAAAETDIRGRIESKIARYLDSLERPEFNYASIKADVEKLFTHPKAGADALINRLKSMDRDSIKAVIASRRDISDAEAERLTQKIEDSRENLLRKAQSLKDKAIARVDQVKEETIHQVDETRKTAATAAWWSFATALVSGTAAAVGGIIAAIT